MSLVTHGLWTGQALVYNTCHNTNRQMPAAAAAAALLIHCIIITRSSLHAIIIIIIIIMCVCVCVCKPWLAEDEAKFLTGLSNSRCVDDGSKFLNVLSHHLSQSVSQTTHRT